MIRIHRCDHNGQEQVLSTFPATLLGYAAARCDYIGGNTQEALPARMSVCGKLVGRAAVYRTTTPAQVGALFAKLGVVAGQQEPPL